MLIERVKVLHNGCSSNFVVLDILCLSESLLISSLPEGWISKCIQNLAFNLNLVDIAFEHNL